MVRLKFENATGLVRGVGFLALVAVAAVAFGHAADAAAPKNKNSPQRTSPSTQPSPPSTGSAASPKSDNASQALKLGVVNQLVNKYIPWGTLSKGADGTPTATGSTPPNTVKFSGLQQWTMGQQVWINPARMEAIAVQFPIHAKRKDNLGDSHYMSTELTVSTPSPTDPDKGRIDGKTRTWSKEALRGFTGGVVVFLMDDKGNILHNAPLHKYGVNGEAVPGALSDRTETWHEPVGKQILAQTRSVAIVHVDSPTSHWDDFVKKAKDVLELAKTASEVYGDVKGGGAHPGGITSSTSPTGVSTGSTPPRTPRR